MSERTLTGARRVVLSALAASLCLAIAHVGVAATIIKTGKSRRPRTPTTCWAVKLQELRRLSW